jgi:O-acetyl-ADP-ribose deacetylase (regulator of RNase III)
MHVYPTGRLVNPQYIINFPTKRHWRGKSRMEDIEAGLEALVGEIRQRGIRSIAVPPLGSGLGGLVWGEVRRRIETALGDLEGVRVVVFEPGGTPSDRRAVRSKDVPRMTPGRAALIGLVDRYHRALLDPFVTLLELHKLTYFMEVAGEPLRLVWKKAPLGPYAENLRHVLNAIEGHLLSGYADGGDRPDKQLQLVPGAVEDALAFLSGQPESLARFKRVCELVEGFESPYGLELLATVHWLVSREQVGSMDELVERTHAWSSRKRRFTPRQIALSADVLAQKGWIPELARSA